MGRPTPYRAAISIFLHLYIAPRKLDEENGGLVRDSLELVLSRCTMLLGDLTSKQVGILDGRVYFLECVILSRGPHSLLDEYRTVEDLLDILRPSIHVRKERS